MSCSIVSLVLVVLLVVRPDAAAAAAAAARVAVLGESESASFAAHSLVYSLSGSVRVSHLQPNGTAAPRHWSRRRSEKADDPQPEHLERLHGMHHVTLDVVSRTTCRTGPTSNRRLRVKKAFF
jgi:hypothetical protein